MVRMMSLAVHYKSAGLMGKKTEDIYVKVACNDKRGSQLFKF